MRTCRWCTVIFLLVSWIVKALWHFIASCWLLDTGLPENSALIYFVPLAKKLERSTVMCLSGCDTGFPYQARQKSTQTLLAVSLVSEVSPDCGWAPLPHCQLKRPSVRLTQTGGGPARLLIKVMSCKIKREGGDSRLLPATLSFILSAGRWTSRSTCFLLSL